MNGRVIRCVDAHKPGGKKANYKIVVRYNITTTHKKDVQLNIRSVQRGGAPLIDGIDIPLPPTAEEIANLQPIPVTVPEGMLVLPHPFNQRRAYASNSTASTSDTVSAYGEFPCLFSSSYAFRAIIDFDGRINLGNSLIIKKNGQFYPPLF